jgi:crotonobetaine/carnitine-CoA ligase
MLRRLVPLNAGAAMFRTIPDVFGAAVERSPSAPWLRFEDVVFRFEEAYDRVAAAASMLRDLDVGRGTPVLTTARNSPEYLFTWLAVTRLGALFLPVNPESSAAELEGFAAQLRPEVVITEARLRDAVAAALSRTAPDARIALAADLVFSPTKDAPPAAARPDDVAVLIPTSGTTGRSKLVMQTHRAYVMAGEGFPFWLGLTHEDRLMTSLPLFHINAPAYSVMGSLVAGAGLILLSRFSGSRFIDWARRYGATEFNAIGAMLEILMRQPKRDDDADNPLRLCYTGPSPTKERQLEMERRFGFEIVCGYALSESPYGLIWRRGTRPFGTLGSPRQHPTMGDINHARVVADGRRVGPGEVGELELNNPAIMLGYYNMPEETETVLVDGWLRTGDLVRVNDDGTFSFVGRKKELIRRRGENLSPLEVEMVLEGHPAVHEAAVVGVPSQLSEEDVKAFVVLARDVTVSLAELRDFAAARLAPFKVPRYIEIVQELPHTPTGRIAKHELPRDRTDEELDFEAEPVPQSGDQ